MNRLEREPVLPGLFDAWPTTPSPICCYGSPCPRRGRAVLSAPERIGDDCENQAVKCLTCGASGVLSRNLTIGASR